MTEEKWFRPVYIILWAWKESGWGTIIYLAAMAGIDPQLYDAASVDGAGRFRKMVSVTLPSIIPTVVIMFILSVPGIIGADFESVLLMQNQSNRSVSQIIGTFVYEKAFSTENVPRFDYAAAVGLFFSVLGLIIVAASNYLSKKLTKYSLW